MNAKMIISLTGWLACILIGLEVLTPYLLRTNRLSEWLGTVKFASKLPYLQRMWPHYWIGYVLVVLAVIHTWVPMQARRMGLTNGTGLWIATVALLLMLVQGTIGWWLKDPTFAPRGATRRWHYRLMFGIVMLVGAHLWLNG
jgi:hypothetical protein